MAQGTQCYHGWHTWEVTLSFTLQLCTLGCKLLSIQLPLQRLHHCMHSITFCAHRVNQLIECVCQALLHLRVQPQHTTPSGSDPPSHLEPCAQAPQNAMAPSSRAWAPSWQPPALPRYPPCSSASSVTMARLAAIQQDDVGLILRMAKSRRQRCQLPSESSQRASYMSYLARMVTQRTMRGCALSC